MREIKPTKLQFKHKVFVNDAPLFKLMPKKEFALFIATLEMEIRDFYKEADDQHTDTHPP